MASGRKRTWEDVIRDYSKIPADADSSSSEYSDTSSDTSDYTVGPPHWRNRHEPSDPDEDWDDLSQRELTPG